MNSPVIRCSKTLNKEYFITTFAIKLKKIRMKL